MTCGHQILTSAAIPLPIVACFRESERGPFASIEALQAALDSWRQEYNTDRPHQSLGMAFPASRFTMAQVSPLELRVPARQG